MQCLVEGMLTQIVCPSLVMLPWPCWNNWAAGIMLSLRKYSTRHCPYDVHHNFLSKKKKNNASVWWCAHVVTRCLFISEELRLLHHHLYHRYKHLLSAHKWDIACGCPNLNLILYQRLLHPLSSDLAGAWRIKWPDEDYAMWQTDNTPQNSYGMCPWTYWGLKSWQLAMWWGWRCEAARTCFDDTE
jgi:hypothetical protein